MRVWLSEGVATARRGEDECRHWPTTRVAIAGCRQSDRHRSEQVPFLFLLVRAKRGWASNRVATRFIIQGGQHPSSSGFDANVGLLDVHHDRDDIGHHPLSVPSWRSTFTRHHPLQLDFLFDFATVAETRAPPFLSAESGGFFHVLALSHESRYITTAFSSRSSTTRHHARVLESSHRHCTTCYAQEGGPRSGQCSVLL